MIEPILITQNLKMIVRVKRKLKATIETAINELFLNFKKVDFDGGFQRKIHGGNSEARKKIMYIWELRKVIRRLERKKKGEANQISPFSHSLYIQCDMKRSENSSWCSG